MSTFIEVELTTEHIQGMSMRQVKMNISSDAILSFRQTQNGYEILIKPEYIDAIKKSLSIREGIASIIAKSNEIKKLS